MSIFLNPPEGPPPQPSAPVAKLRGRGFGGGIIANDAGIRDWGPGSTCYLPPSTIHAQRFCVISVICGYMPFLRLPRLVHSHRSCHIAHGSSFMSHRSWLIVHSFHPITLCTATTVHPLILMIFSGLVRPLSIDTSFSFTPTVLAMSLQIAWFALPPSGGADTRR